MATLPLHQEAPVVTLRLRIRANGVCKYYIVSLVFWLSNQ